MQLLLLLRSSAAAAGSVHPNPARTRSDRQFLRSELLGYWYGFINWISIHHTITREVLLTLNTSKNIRVIIVVERIMSAPDIATQMNETMRQSSSVGVGVVVVATSSTDTNSIGRHSTKPKPCGVDRGPRGGIYDPFPLKFHRVLDEIAHEGLDSVVSWVSHGRAFKIHNPSLFVTDVMPRFFSQSKYTSFQRQLNLYGESHISVDIVV